MDKKKLTLSVDAQVIEKAKKLGLNLSVITENALRITSFSEDSKGISRKERLIEAYRVVFQAMSLILKKWDAQIMIGQYKDFVDSEHKLYDTFSYYLVHDKIYLWDEVIAEEEPLQTWKLTSKNLPVEKFYGPERIIKELIDKLYSLEEEDKIRIKKLEVITNLLKLSGLTEEENEN